MHSTSIDDLLFIHPLSGMNKAWSGYLVESAASVPDHGAILRLARHPSIRDFDQRHPWLLPATPGLVGRCDIANSVHLFANPLSEEAQLLEAELRRIRQPVGLCIAPGEKLPMTGTWDFVVITANHARSLPPFTLIGLASRTRVVATEVHSYADYTWAQSNNCALSTAEFLLSRKISDASADITRTKLLEMLALIAADADTGALEEIFRQEPKLSYSLLRLVNSAAIAPRSPITSFAQAINLLGRRQLQRWLQLLVFADTSNGHQANPLLQKAAARGRQMELLASVVAAEAGEDNLNDTAFMIGAFSLLDVLLNMSMHEVLRHLPLPQMVQSALTEQVGALGKLLHVICLAERRNLTDAAQALAQTSISSETFLDAQLGALSWAAKIHPAP